MFTIFTNLRVSWIFYKKYKVKFQDKTEVVEETYKKQEEAVRRDQPIEQVVKLETLLKVQNVDATETNKEAIIQPESKKGKEKINKYLCDPENLVRNNS